MAKIPILLIDDDAFLAQIYTQKLEIEGFDVHLAGSGEDGLKLVVREPPACILLDILLPGMDGFEVLEKLKADEETAKIPVIMVSNMGQREDVERAKQLGATSYLIKSHTLPGDVLRKVKEVLGLI